MPSVAIESPAKLTSPKHEITMLLIALFKLFKGISLALVGFGALKLLHHDAAQTVAHWVDVLRIDPDNHFVHAAVARVTNVSPGQLKAVSAGTFFYASLLLTEGVGLLLHKGWAEYFTIISTGVLVIPELYEIAKHVTAVKVIILIINVAIVVYLVVRVRQRREASEAAH